MKKNGFTLVELLAVIVVLGVVMVLATTTVLPMADEARIQAFKTEATSVINAAENAKNLYSLGEITLPANSCDSAAKICFTITDLFSLGLYKGDKTNYVGTITINKSNNSNILNLKKGVEFAIIGGTKASYIKDEDTNIKKVSDWVPNSHENCVCE